MVKLPASLLAGRYRLVVTVTDQQANRVTEATANVQIVEK